jgi:hypothetical protein
MTSPITNAPAGAHAQLAYAQAAASADAQEAAACALLPPGWACSKPAGHEPPCEAVQINTEPPVTDPPVESAPAAPSAPYATYQEALAAAAATTGRKYGFKKRREFELELPSGGFVLVRQLTLPKAIELGILNMKDSFAAKLLKDINSDDPAVAQDAAEQVEAALRDDQRRENFFGPLNRVTAAALICPTAILQGEPTGDDQIHVDDIDLLDKNVIFEAAMPEEMKAAALEEQRDALKSVRVQPADGVRDFRDGDTVPSDAE